jgi:hypothetical protein
VDCDTFRWRRQYWRDAFRDAFGGKRRVCRTCVVEQDGRSFCVDDPKVVPVDEVMALLSPLLVRIVRWHETEHALLLHIAEPVERLSA